MITLIWQEDLLLLGSAADVFLTPMTVYVAPKGLTDNAAYVTLVTSEGINKNLRLRDVSAFERLRLYLTWGHEEEPYSLEVRHLKPSAAALEPKKKGRVARYMHTIHRTIQWMNSRIKVGLFNDTLG